MNYIVLSISLVLLGITIYLSIRGRDTLSQRYQKLFPTWFDMIVFGVGLIGMCFWKHYYPQLHNGLVVFLCGFWGHITFPNKERFTSW